MLRDSIPRYVGRSVGPLLGSSPEGVDDLCFHTYGEFSPPPPLLELGLEARIWASRLGYWP